ncbi:McrC family protein [Luteimonas qiangzhengi]|uniref:McrC family protein n=1 Tax=Luteimonas sp. MJ146 TaxID=3129240 RepID=UPI0031BA6BA1
MKRKVRCQEWGKVQVGPSYELSSQEEVVSILNAWNEVTGKDPAGYFEISGSWLMPKFWSGVLETAELVVEVSPIGSHLLPSHLKSALDANLSAMLAATLSSREDGAGFASLSLDGGRFDALLTAFCEDLQLARRKRVLRSYRTEQASLVSPRGRIVFPQQSYEAVRRPGRFVSEWVGLSEDVLANQLFKEVLRRYRPRCSSRVRARIDTCLSELDHVSELSGEVSWGGISSQRRIPEIYMFLLKQSLFLLGQDAGAGVFSGDALAIAEVVFTSKLFEQFIDKELASVASSFGVISLPQSRGTFACADSHGTGAFELIPDNRIVDNRGKTLAIIDTKWKVLDMAKRQLGISRDDIYQILVYGARFDCRALALIYPDVSVESGQLGWSTEFTATLAGQEYSLHIVKVPLLDRSLLPIRSSLESLVRHHIRPGADGYSISSAA